MVIVLTRLLDFRSWTALERLIMSVAVSVLQPFSAPVKQVAEAAGCTPEADGNSVPSPVIL